MAFVYYNPNPLNNHTIDCTIRAISKLMETDWDTTYINLLVQGYIDKSMPSSDHVWGNFLRRNGYSKHVLPDEYMDRYTVSHFANDNPYGRFLLKAPGHVVAVCNGDYYDTWDSGNEVPIYYWKKNGE